METFLLVVITLQGFAAVYFEYEVWKMARDRYLERAKWREAKRLQQLKRDANDAAKSL